MSIVRFIAIRVLTALPPIWFQQFPCCVVLKQLKTMKKSPNHKIKEQHSINYTFSIGKKMHSNYQKLTLAHSKEKECFSIDFQIN
jgi:hypothetical protein